MSNPGTTFFCPICGTPFCVEEGMRCHCDLVLSNEENKQED